MIGALALHWEDTVEAAGSILADRRLIPDGAYRELRRRRPQNTG